MSGYPKQLSRTITPDETDARDAVRAFERPLAIEAIRWNTPAGWMVTDWLNSYLVPYDVIDSRLVIHTPEGDRAADAGDWIIRGIHGDFYPCRSEVFEAGDEPAGDR